MIVNVTCWTKNEQLVTLLGDINLQRPGKKHIPKKN